MTPWQLFLLQQLVDKGTGIVATIIATVLGALFLRQLKRNAAERREQIAVSPLDAASLQGWARGVDEKLAEHDGLLARIHDRPAVAHRPLQPTRRSIPMKRTAFGAVVPQVLDPAVRAFRTAAQVLIAFLTLAPVLPLIVTAIGAPAGSDFGLWLTGAAAWVAGVAAAVSRVMAIPAVNALLSRIGLGGHSGEYTGGGDTHTQFLTLPTLPAASAAATGE